MIVGEAVYFYHIISKSNTIEKADLIVVFAGEPERIKAGYNLALLGYAPCLVISPADIKKLKEYDKENGFPKTVKRLIEEKARTTLENAVYAKQIISEGRFDSVILVTSIYHMPRSNFLLRMVLAGSDVRVQTHGVDSGFSSGEAANHRIAKRLYYNEMAKFWVSNVELLSYKVWGRLPEQDFRDSRVIKWLKSVVLFSV